MKKLLVAACLILGVGCGPAIAPEEDGAIGSVDQELCQATCPAGTTFVQYTWVCDNKPTSSCGAGTEKEYALCKDTSTGSYVLGTTTCRSRCCLVAVQ
jgi:hypothetical protein